MQLQFICSAEIHYYINLRATITFELHGHGNAP